MKRLLTIAVCLVALLLLAAVTGPSTLTSDVRRTRETLSDDDESASSAAARPVSKAAYKEDGRHIDASTKAARDEDGGLIDHTLKDPIWLEQPSAPATSDAPQPEGPDAGPVEPQTLWRTAFRSEQDDTAWSDVMYRQLQRVAADTLGRDLVIETLHCRETVCRALVTFESEEDAARLGDASGHPGADHAYLKITPDGLTYEVLVKRAGG